MKTVVTDQTVELIVSGRHQLVKVQVFSTNGADVPCLLRSGPAVLGGGRAGIGWHGTLLVSG